MARIPQLVLADLSSVFLCVCLLLLMSVSAALAQSLPAQVTPGGVSPEKNTELPHLNQREEEAVPLLPKSEPMILPLDERTGETFSLNNITIKGAADNKDNGVSLEAIDAIIEMHLNSSSEWTLSRLNRLAVEITNYYRTRDLILSQALILEQSLDDGNAEITVVEGVIGKITVGGSKNINANVIKNLFGGVAGKPSTRGKIESALLYASDLPGVQGRGILQRGEAPGTADMSYTVASDKRFAFYLNGDNYGSEFVGENRLRADLVVNNPTRRGDRLTLSGLTAFNPSNNDYFGFDYTKPFILKKSGKPISWGLSGSHNEFSVGGALSEFTIRGESTRFDAYLAYPYRRSYHDNRTWSLALSGKRSEVFQGEIQSSEDKLTILTLRHMWNKLYNAGKGGGFSLNLTASHGFDEVLGSMPVNSLTSSRVGSSGEHAGGEFDKLNLSFNWNHRLSGKFNLQTRFQLQESDDLLVSLEQFPLGGPNSVRAYPLSSFLTDSGLFAAADLQWQVHPRWQLSVFGDYGEGDLNEPLGSDLADVDISGFGLGLRASLFSNYSILGTAARPSGSVPDGVEDETQFYLSIGASFR